MCRPVAAVTSLYGGRAAAGRQKIRHWVTGWPKCLAAAGRSFERLGRIADLRLGGFAVRPQMQQPEAPLAEPLAAGRAAQRNAELAAQLRSSLPVLHGWTWCR